MEAGRGSIGWGARLLVAAVLILVGAAAAVWALAHYQPAARFLGVVPSTSRATQAVPAQQVEAQPSRPRQPEEALNRAIAEQIGQLQARIQRVESENEQMQGSSGRADALLIAFAARRAIERGASLGYLEPLLVDRFGKEHAQAVAIIVTGSRSPVKLTQLVAEYQDLEPKLLGPPPDEGFWTSMKRGLSSLVAVHRSDRPSTQPQSRYNRALSHLRAGEVDAALAQTMRLPGAPRARDWINSARRYVAIHRALDEIESAALIGTPAAVQ